MKTETNKSVRISKILLISILTTISMAVVTGLVLAIIFKPYRYAGMASEIEKELSSPSEYHAPNAYLNDTNITYAATHANTELVKTKTNTKGFWEDDAKELKKMFEGVPMIPAGVTPYIIERNGRDDLIFGGTKEFFKYCKNTDEVTWNIADIEGSIRSREEYLTTKIKSIMLILFPVIFSLSYLTLYIRKHKIKIVIG